MTKDEPTANGHTKTIPGEDLLDVDLPHEGLDLYRVLEEAYRLIAAWQGVSWSRGTTGDQLKRALSGALLRYAEGYYADGGNKASLWKSARASCGEAAAAVQILTLDGIVPQGEAIRVRELLSRAMRMFARLLRPK
ncbi:MAG: hypothetical protein GY851_11050 [bacterium]|nr:hypothetical protein [bacterium]